MRDKLQRPEIIIWIVIVAIVAIVGIASVAVPPLPLGRPTREEAMVWITAFTGAGTLAAVAVALWLGTNADRRSERIRHDNIRPPLAATISWTANYEQTNKPMMWLYVTNYGTHPALNLRIAVVITSPGLRVHRLPLWSGNKAGQAAILLLYQEQRLINGRNESFLYYNTDDEAVQQGASGQIILWYEDTLGWNWENSIPVTFGGDEPPKR